MIRGGGEVVDNDNPGLDVGEVAGTEHEAEEGGSIERVVDLGDGDNEEAEAIGVEAVKLAFIAEACDDGLGMRERIECVMVRKLKGQVIETGGVREVHGVRVGEPNFFNFTVMKEGEKLVIVGSKEVLAVARWKGESGGCKRVTFMMVVPLFDISSSNYLSSYLVIQTRNFNNKRISIKSIKIFKI